MHRYNSPSKLQQYRKLKRLALDGKLGAKRSDGKGCAYVEGDRNCAVGALLTAAQLNYIEARGMNKYAVTGLALSCNVGRKNLEAVTGFTLRELEVMQHSHDRAPNELRSAAPETSSFVAWLNKQIAKEEAKNA